jgi:intein/homing endonuclease
MKIPFFFSKKPIKKLEIPEKIFETPEITVKDIIAPSSILLEPGFLVIGERYLKSFFVFSYPRYLATAWLSPVINLDVPMDIAIHIHPFSSEIVLKQIRKKITEVLAEIQEREERGLIRDPQLETAYQDLEALRERLITAQERVFKVGIYLSIYGNSEKELKDTETTLRSIFESKLIYLKPTTFRQKQGHITTSPHCLDQIQSLTPLNTATLSTCFPFLSVDLSSNEGILYGINRHNNSLILFDRFSLENANEVVFGKSGSGKSIRGTEPVIVRNKGKIRLVKIGNLVDKLIKKYGATEIDEEMEGVIFPPDLEVYSFDKNLKGGWSKVTVAARKKAPKIFYKFITKSGREITTTGDHNLVILKNGKIVIAKGSQVKKGDFVPLPREVLAPTETSNEINLLKLLRRSKRVYVMAGNIIKKNYNLLKGANLDKKLHRYLYKYKENRTVPISYFWKIKNYLKLKGTELDEVKIKAKNGEVFYEPQLKIGPDLLKLLGYIISEGTVSKNCIIISNKDQEVIEDVSLAFKNLKIPFYRIKEGVACASRIFLEIVKSLGIKGGSEKRKVPKFIFNLGKKEISYFLSAYFEGDGGVEEMRFSVAASSKSKSLISEIAYLLYYFGIIGRVGKTRKKPTNLNWRKKKVYYKLVISGQDNLRKFAENINFISKRKREKLSLIIQKEGNTNVDIIPEVSHVLKEIYHQLFKCQLHGIQDLSNLARKHYRPSPKKLKEIIKIIEERIKKFEDLGATYKILSELPELSTIIELGKNDRNLNKILWQNLGQSWRVVKNEGVKPFSKNALKIIEITTGKTFPFWEVKKAIHSGFKEIDLPIGGFSKTLQSALTARPESNTSYEIIQKAAHFVWQKYQDILENKLPKVKEKLEQLKILAKSDLFWDPIVEIKKIENKRGKYVYDLTVDNGVFLAGYSGMFVHNSYFVKLEILRSLMQGVDVIVVDPENEYKMLSDVVGGSFLNISLASPNHINPFDLPPPREDEKPEDVLRSNIINLVGLMRIMLGGLTPEEDAIMDRALTETYAAKDITPETNPLTWQKNIPILEDLEKVLGGMEGTESLVRRLRKFTKGTFAQFFNQKTNIAMDKPLVVFGIRDMEDELRPIAMYLIMRYIWNQVRVKLKKRVFVVDEAWWIMKEEDGASFLYGICKRGRKHWLGVTTITQDVGDFMKSAYGQPIITNSSISVLFKQSPATIDLVQKSFNLTDEEKYLLLETEVGEGIFFAGQKHVLMKVIASYIEDQIVTSSPEQILKIKMEKG